MSDSKSITISLSFTDKCIPELSALSRGTVLLQGINCPLEIFQLSFLEFLQSRYYVQRQWVHLSHVSLCALCFLLRCNVTMHCVRQTKGRWAVALATRHMLLLGSDVFWPNSRRAVNTRFSCYKKVEMPWFRKNDATVGHLDHCTAHESLFTWIEKFDVEQKNV